MSCFQTEKSLIELCVSEPFLLNFEALFVMKGFAFSAKPCPVAPKVAELGVEHVSTERGEYTLQFCGRFSLKLLTFTGLPTRTDCINLNELSNTDSFMVIERIEPVSNCDVSFFSAIARLYSNPLKL